MKMCKGFTLVEMLVVAPIVILVIGAVVGVIISLVGTAVQASAENSLSYTVNDALNQIQTDVKSSSAFLAENSFPLNSPQGKSNGSSSNLTDTTNNFFNVGSGGNALILSTNATTDNPIDPTSAPIYIADSPNACGAPNYTDNNVEQVNIVYFTTTNGDGTYTLWRRVLRDPSFGLGTISGTATCGNTMPWQQPSCNPSYVKPQSVDANSWCIVKDSALVTGTALSFNVQYYANAASTTVNTTGVSSSQTVASRNTALAGTDTADVAISASTSQSGKNITEGGSIRATRNTTVVNSAQTSHSLTAPSSPTVKASFDPNYGVTFAWNSVDPNATYTLNYSVNGGATQTITNTGLDSSCTGGAPPCTTLPIFTRLTSVEAWVTATNDIDSTDSSHVTITTPAWNPIIYSNLYNDYPGYAPGQYALTSDGVVIFQGLIRHPQAPTASEWITDLPVAYRPDATLIFDIAANGNVIGRVDAYPDGSIRYVAGDMTTANGWVSLSGVEYVSSAAASALSYNPGTVSTWLNSWASYSSPPAWLAHPEYYVTDLGRVFWEGIVKPGTTTDHTPIFNLPNAATQPLYQEQFPVLNGNAVGDSEVYTTGGSGYGTYNGKVASYGGGTSWQSLVSNYYDASSGVSFTALTPANSWVNYGSPWPALGYYKAPDGVVTLRGLIKSGTTTAGTVLGTLPAGCKPSGRLIFSSLDAAAFGRVDVNTDGTLIIEAGSSASWLDLDGISFMAADPNAAC